VPVSAMKKPASPSSTIVRAAQVAGRALGRVVGAAAASVQPTPPSPAAPRKRQSPERSAKTGAPAKRPKSKARRGKSARSA